MAKPSFYISGFASLFRLFLLGALIVAVMSFYNAASSTVGMQNRVIIALATVIVYGMSDWLLSYILGFACDCDQHRNS